MCTSGGTLNDAEATTSEIGRSPSGLMTASAREDEQSHTRPNPLRNRYRNVSTKRLFWPSIGPSKLLGWRQGTGEVAQSQGKQRYRSRPQSQILAGERLRGHPQCIELFFSPFRRSRSRGGACFQYRLSRRLSMLANTSAEYVYTCVGMRNTRTHIGEHSLAVST